MIALARSPVSATLRSLDLHGTGIGESGSAALLDSPHLGRLTKLTLPYNASISQPTWQGLQDRFGPRS